MREMNLWKVFPWETQLFDSHTVHVNPVLKTLANEEPVPAVTEDALVGSMDESVLRVYPSQLVMFHPLKNMLGFEACLTLQSWSQNVLFYQVKLMRGPQVGEFGTLNSMEKRSVRLSLPVEWAMFGHRIWCMVVAFPVPSDVVDIVSYGLYKVPLSGEYHRRECLVLSNDDVGAPGLVECFSDMPVDLNLEIVSLQFECPEVQFERLQPKQEKHLRICFWISGDTDFGERKTSQNGNFLSLETIMQLLSLRKDQVVIMAAALPSCSPNAEVHDMSAVFLDCFGRKEFHRISMSGKGRDVMENDHLLRSPSQPDVLGRIWQMFGLQTDVLGDSLCDLAGNFSRRLPGGGSVREHPNKPVPTFSQLQFLNPQPGCEEVPGTFLENGQDFMSGSASVQSHRQRPTKVALPPVYSVLSTEGQSVYKSVATILPDIVTLFYEPGGHLYKGTLRLLLTTEVCSAFVYKVLTCYPECMGASKPVGIVFGDSSVLEQTVEISSLKEALPSQIIFQVVPVQGTGDLKKQPLSDGELDTLLLACSKDHMQSYVVGCQSASHSQQVMHWLENARWSAKSVGLAVTAFLAALVLSCAVHGPLGDGFLEVARFPTSLDDFGIYAVFTTTDDHWCIRETLWSWLVFTPLRVAVYWAHVAAGLKQEVSDVSVSGGSWKSWLGLEPKPGVWKSVWIMIQQFGESVFSIDGLGAFCALLSAVALVAVGSFGSTSSSSPVLRSRNILCLAGIFCSFLPCVASGQCRFPCPLSVFLSIPAALSVSLLATVGWCAWKVPSRRNATTWSICLLQLSFVYFCCKFGSSFQFRTWDVFVAYAFVGVSTVLLLSLDLLSVGCIGDWATSVLGKLLS
ncbi:unnamed protein product [Notodromas monacha]|uniref:Uncharacterized protein n=2 Tax=Notodromas monacha TaxID=399045 RepID=A0A7R9BUF1_9CRUS|nr:unnamed protein product [Notodromas monacha]CAG0920393.1 unnamed protein product [Notodromas monacha]